jgi:hypothetical protein
MPLSKAKADQRRRLQAKVESFIKYIADKRLHLTAAKHRRRKVTR